MDKVQKFVNENYKLIIPIGFMAVLFIAFFIYYRISISNQYHIDTEEEVFQYFYDRKYEYKALISKNKKDVIVDLKSTNEKVNYDSTPLYTKKGNTVIFPEDMSVVMPTLNCSEYLSPKYSYITFKDGIYTLTTKKYHDKLNHYFLFDGNDLYFFIENVTLVVNNDKIELSPYSYLIAKYNNYLSYYDKKSDTFKTIKVGNSGISIENEYYKILVDRDVIEYQGGNFHLTSSIENLYTIDKKG